jgi:hypothetical protein
LPAPPVTAVGWLLLQQRLLPPLALLLVLQQR